MNLEDHLQRAERCARRTTPDVHEAVSALVQVIRWQEARIERLEGNSGGDTANRVADLGHLGRPLGA